MEAHEGGRMKISRQGPVRIVEDDSCLSLRGDCSARRWFATHWLTGAKGDRYLGQYVALEAWAFAPLSIDADDPGICEEG
jgi:hypothetical protein